MNKLILDFSNLAYLSLFATTRTPEVLEDGYDGHYRVFVSKVMNLLKITGMDVEVIFALDSFPHAKKDIYPGYKEGRKKFDFDPRKGLLSALNETVDFKVAKVTGYEADDVMASIVARNLDVRTTVATSDKDLWVLMQYPNCNILDVGTNEFVTFERFQDKYGLTDYRHITLYKTLWGDTSDRVPNAMPRSQKQLMPVIAKTDGTLNSFFKEFDLAKATISKTNLDRFDANFDQLIDNYTLVSLDKNLNVDCLPYTRGLEYQL